MTDIDVDEKYQKGRRKAFRATYRRFCNVIAKRDFNKKYVELDNSQQKQVYEKYKKEEPKEYEQNPVTFENYDEDAKLLELIKKIPSIRKKSTKVPKQVETAEKDRVFKTKPVRDWSSHYCDAMRYLATGFEEDKYKSVNRQRTAINEYKII